MIAAVGRLFFLGECAQSGQPHSQQLYLDKPPLRRRWLTKPAGFDHVCLSLIIDLAACKRSAALPRGWTRVSHSRRSVALLRCDVELIISHCKPC